jgi:hypothetical protein
MGTKSISVINRPRSCGTCSETNALAHHTGYLCTIRVVICSTIAIASLQPALVAAANVDASIAKRFEEFSLPTPTPTSVIICHGFGCRFRTPIALSAADDAKLSQFLSAGRASAEAERKAVAQAVAWFQRRVAPEAGTASAKAYATGVFDAQPSQFDCIDASTNTTTTLLVLSELGLLKYHRLVAPVSRSPLLGLGVIHTTAVLVELQGGREWAIDSWVRNNGDPPDVLPLKAWYAGN